MLQDFKGLNKRKNNSKLCSLINLNKYNKVKNILVIIYFLDFLKRYIKLFLFLDFLLQVKIKTPKFLHELYLNLSLSLCYHINLLIYFLLILKFHHLSDQAQIYLYF